ncbi:MAG: nitronate monooxygenase [Dysgonamonadaceae bacterium]|jgi:enoyl-[acyl-carrier protein] reductase II|nr:nitronate monooxygenase [Dysgonamonadaceae bacterium]
MTNRLTDLLNIKYPVIQGGMVWCCGWRLASAVSNSGGLGLLGAGSMSPEILREHIQKCRAATAQPFGVNVPLIYKDVEGIIQVIMEERIPIVVSSAGNPKTWTKQMKDKGITVIHVVSSSKFAQKAEEAGVDAVIAEGFEAGGHNGREETTTMALIPQVRRAVSLPLIAAGGIATGSQMLAALCLGADGVQIGTLFALSEESSASPEFKRICTELKEGDTQLVLKNLSPTRLIKNAYYEKIKAAEDRGANTEELLEIIGKGRTKLGIFEGNLIDGELEIGQVASLIRKVESVEAIIHCLIDDYNLALGKLKPLL